MSTWSDWKVIDTSIKHSICQVYQNADGRLEFFALDASRCLMHIWEISYDKYPRHWEPFKSYDRLNNLVVGTNQDGRLEVFVVDKNGSVHHIWQMRPNAGWSDWNELKFTNDAINLAVGNNQDGRLEVFVIDKNGSVHHIWQMRPNGTWSNWNELKFTNVATDLAIGNNQDGRLEVFVTDKNGSVHHIWQMSPNGTWSDWSNSLACEKGCTALDVARNKDGRLEVFVLSEGNLKSIRQAIPNGAWRSWITHDFKEFSDFGVSKNLKVLANEEGALEVYAINKDGILLHAYQQSINSDYWVKMSLEIPPDSPYPSPSDLKSSQLTFISVFANRRGGIDVYGVNTYKKLLRIERSGVKRNFVLWASKVLITENIEHTWVEAINPDDEFKCFSPFKPDRARQLLITDASGVAQKRANHCRGTMDACFINYIVNGYCHQASNRFLMHIGKSIDDLPKNLHPGGYTWTHFCCGPYGTSNNFNTWYRNRYIPSLSRFPSNEKISVEEDPFQPDSLNSRILQIYLNADKNNMDSNEVIIKCTALLLADKTVNYQNEPFASKQRDILRKRDAILSQAGFMKDSEVMPRLSRNEVISFSKEINELGREMQLSLKEIIGADNYKMFTEGDETIYDLVDIDLAVEIYAK